MAYRMIYGATCSFRLTEEDWRILEELARNRFSQRLPPVANNKVPHLHAYMNSALHKLKVGSGNTLPTIGGDKTKYRYNFRVPEEAMEYLSGLAQISGNGVATIVERLYLNPLFLEHYTNDF